MEERRKIDRVKFEANSVIVDRETEQKYYGRVKNISPLGLAIEIDASIPSLLNRDVVVVAETLIMYADVIREESEQDGKRIIALTARRFSQDVLQYLFDHIG